MIGVEQIPAVEECSADVFHVIVTECLAEDLEKVFRPHSGWRHAFIVVKSRMNVPRVDVPPLISEGVGVDAVDVESLCAIPL